MRIRITHGKERAWYEYCKGLIVCPKCYDEQYEQYICDGGVAIDKADAEVVPDAPSEEMMDKMMDVMPTDIAVGCWRDEIKAAWRRLFQPEETAAERAKRLWKELCDNQLTDNKVPEKLWNKIAEHQYCMVLTVQEASKGEWTDAMAYKYANYRKDCYMDEKPFLLPHAWLSEQERKG